MYSTTVAVPLLLRWRQSTTQEVAWNLTVYCHVWPWDVSSFNLLSPLIQHVQIFLHKGKSSLPLEGFRRWGSQLQGFGTKKNTGYSRNLKTQMDQENTRRDQRSGNKISDSSWTCTIIQEEVGVRREKVGEEVLVGREGEMGAYITSGRTGHSSSSV